MAVLIVGGDSKIGAALAAHLQHAGAKVLRTSRRPAHEPGILRLDLTSAADWESPEHIDTAILCAANASIQACRDHPQATRQVNVGGILRVAEKLHAQGAFIVFLSTNAVFDGSIPHTPADVPRSPMTEYGRQKAEAERRLLALGGSVAIVRFAKVLTPPVPLFEQWKAELLGGRTIEPYADMSIAPIPLAAAVELLRRIGERRQAGIYQFSGERDVSYAEIAGWLAEHLGAPRDRVRPVSAAGRGEHVPRHTTLNTDRVRQELGLNAPDVEWTVRQAFTR